MKKLLFVLLALALVLFPSCDFMSSSADRQYEEMTGENVVLRGTWEADGITFSSDKYGTHKDATVKAVFTADTVRFKVDENISPEYSYQRSLHKIRIYNDPDQASYPDYIRIEDFVQTFSGGDFTIHDINFLPFFDHYADDDMTFHKISEECAF